MRSSGRRQVQQERIEGIAGETAREGGVVPGTFAHQSRGIQHEDKRPLIA